MLKFLLQIFAAIGIAIVGGVSSLWWALDVPHQGVVVAEWTADLVRGMPDADPYSKARSAGDGSLALGRQEGFTFVAVRDSDGAALQRACRYTVEGLVPPARIWTLYAADAADGPMGKTPLSSYGALYAVGGTVMVRVGPGIEPGNWLASGGEGEMRLVLTLYDAPALGRTGVSDLALPRVIKAGCDA